MTKRVMTSAIPDMSVAEVRKALGEVRRRANLQTLQKPFFITDSLTDTLSIQEFCLKFECGHHAKRHNKGKKPNRSDSGSSDLSDDDADAQVRDG